MSQYTFLFTDIEGSTRLWEDDPAAMSMALARHDDLLRSVVSVHGGQVFKTVGDAVFAVFTDASAATAAALAAQTALAGESWPTARPLRVRMALHSGPAHQRDGDYFGLALNRLARMLAAGHGGQVLVSQATRNALAVELPPAADLRDLGEHTLRDLVRPEHIFQLDAPGLAGDFPALRSLAAFSHNLPVQLTSFIGRERELADVRAGLAATRLLTLTGPGGTGKTRLSLQVAAEVLDAYRDGVWLVELAPLADPALLPQTVAAVLGVREDPGLPALTSLTRGLRDRELLLILDNCEHLVEAAAGMVEALLRGCPALRILASSREALGIAGETSYRVPSLSVPDQAERVVAPLPSEGGNSPAVVQPSLDLAQLGGYEAVRLFLERVLQLQPAFTLTQRNAPAVVQICRRLDGIPLALELAAARVKVLPVEGIAARLDDRFRLLTGGSRTALPRQQTLQALIDWSWDLLSPEERLILRRLSVFAGGWTLEAAEAIVGGLASELPTADLDILDGLSGLVNKSLVVLDDGSERPRYRMLETIRQYSRDKLLSAGEAGALRDIHTTYFVRAAKTIGAAAEGEAHESWLARAADEYDNLRAALEWASGQEQAILLAELVTALRFFWIATGWLTEGRRWAATALELRDTLSQQQRMALGSAAAALAREQGDHGTSLRLLQENVAMLREIGDLPRLAQTLTLCGGGSWFEAKYDQAQAYSLEALDIWRSLDRLGDMGLALHALGLVAEARHDYPQAAAYFQESLGLLRQAGNVENIAYTLNNLGEVARCQGDYALAAQYYNESLTMRRKNGDRRGIAASLHNLAWVAKQNGEPQKATSLFRESMQEARRLDNRRMVGYCLSGLGGVAIAEGRPERAVRLLGASAALFAAIAAHWEVADRLEYERSLELSRGALDAAAWEAAWDAGQALSTEQAVAYALADD